MAEISRWVRFAAIDELAVVFVDHSIFPPTERMHDKATHRKAAARSGLDHFSDRAVRQSVPGLRGGNGMPSAAFASSCAINRVEMDTRNQRLRTTASYGPGAGMVVSMMAKSSG